MLDAEIQFNGKKAFTAVPCLYDTKKYEAPTQPNTPETIVPNP